MDKARKYLVFGAILVYIVLVIFKVPMSKNVFPGLLGLVLLNQGYDQIKIYKRTKSKENLIIPIGNFILIILCAILIVKNMVN